MSSEKSSTSSEEGELKKLFTNRTDTATNSETKSELTRQEMQEKQVIPGLGAYSDSSDSETSSDES